MYAYDAVSGNLKCVSCNPSGAPPTTDVAASDGGPFMSNDGRTFFSTGDALVPADTDGLFDVYEYVDGRPQLISAGTGSEDLFTGAFGGAFYPSHRTGLEAVSANGVDVYFSTFDTLVPQDLNGDFVKFYDARTNGGFPIPTVPLPCVAADECHGPGSSPVDQSQLATNGSLGNGGNVSSASPTGKQKRKRKKHRHSVKRHSRHQTGAQGRSHG
jgi:hypothetical protein